MSEESDEASAKICECGEEYHLNEDTTVNLVDWLQIEPTCSECGISGCPHCLVTCMTCANEGDDNPVLCKQCSDLSNVCNLHNWYVCKKHNGKKCGECYANKNYDRYGMF